MQSLYKKIRDAKNVVGVKFDGSGCSCCRSQYFEIIEYDKKADNVRVLCYTAQLKHDKGCPIIRCVCENPFQWNNPIITTCDIMQIIQNNGGIQNVLARYNIQQFDLEMWYNNQLILQYNDRDKDNYHKKNYRYYF